MADRRTQPAQHDADRRSLAPAAELNPGAGRAAPTTRLIPGTAAYRAANLALFIGGFGTYALLYCVQPLLPIFTQEFGVTPAESSLSISFSTLALSVALPIAGTLSAALHRKPMMSVALAAASALTLLSAFAAGFDQLLALRLLSGLALAGLPSVIMAYIGEEFDSRSVGVAMGLSIAGNGLGGMSGRVGMSLLAESIGWRPALAVIGGMGLGSAALLWWSLAPSRHFVPAPLRLRRAAGGLWGQLRDPALLPLFLTAFLLMGCFVTVYNYVEFRLLQPPFSLDQTSIGLIFTLYVAGVGGSLAAGFATDRIGRRSALLASETLLILGILLIRSDRLAIVITGIGVVTAGFFAAHSVASAWVTRRARGEKGQATALYLFSYYMGSSIIGTAMGVVYHRAGWTGVTGGLFVLSGLAVVLALRTVLSQPREEA